jgi:uncharacterized protein YqeY
VTGLKDQLQEATITAMKSHDKPLLGILRLINAAIKQREIDERITLDDAQILAVLDKMTKQRRESLAQYQTANRQDLADQEQFELDIIQRYLPTPLTDDELNALIKQAIAATGAASMQDMGKVMNILKPQVQGRTDMGSLSNKIKTLLSA